MKHKAKSLLITLLTALMIMTMLPATAFAASKKVPSKVSVTKVTASTNAVTVKWKKASNATSYRIYYKQSGAKKWITVANVTGTSYTHKSNKKTPLVGGKKYVYTVRAYNKSSRKWGSYNTKGKTVTIPAVPSTVKMGNVKGTAYNKVSISWNKANNATSYRIYYKKSGASKWTTLADVSSSKTSYTHTSSKKYPLVSGSKYVYTVRAYNKTSKKWGGYNTKGVSVTVPKKNSKPTTVPVTKISFSPIILELKLNVGETYQLKPILEPSNTTQKDLVWSSDHPEYISVDKNGKITILRDGADVVITARSASNSKISGSCEVKSWTGKPIETIKVSKIECNPSSVSMKVGESKSITTTIFPENAEDTYITWESSNPDIADVYDMTMGKAEISAYKAGTATITAHAEDGSNVVGKCTVTVTENVPEATATATPTPTPNPSSVVETVNLAGGESDTIGPDMDEFESVNFKNVTFEYQNVDNVLKISGFNFTQYAAGVTIKGLKQGSAVIIAKYNGTILKRYNVNVTSNWSEYMGYVAWRKDVESQIWNGNMSTVQKLDAAQNYIKTEFRYSNNNASAAIYAYKTKKIDCFSASEIFGDFAKDLNLRVGYMDYATGTIYDYLADATAHMTGHMCNAVMLDGQWVRYDAQPSTNTAVD